MPSLAEYAAKNACPICDLPAPVRAEIAAFVENRTDDKRPYTPTIQAWLAEEHGIQLPTAEFRRHFHNHGRHK